MSNSSLFENPSLVLLVSLFVAFALNPANGGELGNLHAPETSFKFSALQKGGLEASDVSLHHPDPQLQRKQWVDLTGPWRHVVVTKGDEVEVGSAVGESRLGENESTWAPILVPFCPESSLSGVGKLIESDQALWYQLKLGVKPVAGERTLLHFGAVDHEAAVWVNGKEMGKHVGGNTPFSFDISSALASDGNNTLTVRVHDATEGWQLRGKQALKPNGITYTRVTGIWQTVWMEQVPDRHVEDLDFETVVGKENAGAGASLLVKTKFLDRQCRVRS
ncbi:MAG: hypothetical protein EOP84_02085 [Verrucomicrobiaceae bacterium]|nr:MAG: hypothetical protein EOP84_02085 [Verrucomicrobiaceae bacterium]